jgi:N-succinyldiaminopimelate aminotransferase
MNPGLTDLQPYPFERLATLLKEVTPAMDCSRIALTIGEPQHAPPEFAKAALIDAMDSLGRYPPTIGSETLRQVIADWLCRRFALESVNPATQVLPVNGTREALFAIAQVVVRAGSESAVLSPNPFYQIYEGAALLAGTTPHFIPGTENTGFIPDYNALTDQDWARCELLYLCTPGNPSGATIPEATLQQLIQLADEHDFVIASDECYSEIYRADHSPPHGLLQAAAAMGRHTFERCLVFHSLSKRSNLPGLRSGFVAGDATLIDRFRRYRTYHGCAMPDHHQAVSIAAWSDEAHVVLNRERYTEKFDRIVPILNPYLGITTPEAGFYLWPETPVDDEQFAKDLIAHCNVAVLPGKYLGRTVAGNNPGSNRVRMALVAEIDQCVEAAQRIANFLQKG